MLPRRWLCNSSLTIKTGGDFMAMPKNRRYMDAPELADYINSTTGSVRVMTSRREIPHIKRGRRVLYDRSEIDAWLDAQRVAVTK
jgi:excisionase family DNA binding protein